MKNLRNLVVVLPMASLFCVVVACGPSEAVISCCECLTAPNLDAEVAEDDTTNCLADEDVSSPEADKCVDNLNLKVLIGGDNGTSMSLRDDSCRETCFDACADVDPQVSFETPVVSAGTMTASVAPPPPDVTLAVLEEATHVTVSTGPNQDNFVVNINATTDQGAWSFALTNLPRGAGSFPFGQFTDFSMITSTAGAATGTFDVTAFDDRSITFSFSGTRSDTTAFSGEVFADFTVNDGEVSGILGLQ